MGRMEKRILLAVLTVLAVALGLLLFQSAVGADVPAVHRVSILLDGTGEEYVRSFRRGVEQAARESSVDVRYIARYDGETADGQAEAVRTELESGVDGLVVVPVAPEKLTDALSEAPAGLKVAVAGPSFAGERVVACVSADNVEMGRRLADAMAEDGMERCTILLRRSDGAAVQQRYEGLTGRLDELGIHWDAWKGMTSLRFPADGALAALEPELAETLCGNSSAKGRVYGVGSSNLLLHYLEEEVAAALVVQSDYDAGYLTLMAVADALDGRTTQDVVLDCYTARSGNMFQDPMDQILVPIS